MICKMVKKHPLITPLLVGLAVVTSLQSGYAGASNVDHDSFGLSGTMWETATEGTGIKPEILYAVALQESRELNEQGLAVPDPFVIRYGNQVERFDGFPEARNYLQKLLAQPDIKLKRLDIGLMQINAGWHRHRVEELSDLLVPGLAIRAAATLLSEIAQSTSDPVRLLGRYHSYTPELTLKYGSSVQGIYCRLVNNNDLEICGGVYGLK